jgi:hypothetical protein
MIVAKHVAKQQEALRADLRPGRRPMTVERPPSGRSTVIDAKRRDVAPQQSRCLTPMFLFVCVYYSNMMLEWNRGLWPPPEWFTKQKQTKTKNKKIFLFFLFLFVCVCHSRVSEGAWGKQGLWPPTSPLSSWMVLESRTQTKNKKRRKKFFCFFVFCFFLFVFVIREFLRVLEGNRGYRHSDLSNQKHLKDFFIFCLFNVNVNLKWYNVLLTFHYFVTILLIVCFYFERDKQRTWNLLFFYSFQHVTLKSKSFTLFKMLNTQNLKEKRYSTVSEDFLL